MKHLQWIGLVLVAVALWGTWRLTTSGHEGEPLASQGLALDVRTQDLALGPETTGAPSTPQEVEADPDSERAPVPSAEVLELTVGETQETPWTLVFTGEGQAPLDGLEVSITLERDEDGPDGLGLEQALEGAPALKPDGRAIWEVTAAGWERARVEAWAPGFTSLFKSLPIRKGETELLELEFGATVTGYLVDRLGRPAGKTYVGIRKRDAKGELGYLIGDRTDEAGRFRLSTIAQGPCLLEAEGKHLGRAELTLDLLPRELRNVGKLVLQGEAEIVGQVVLADSQPASDLYIGIELLGEAISPGISRGRLTTDKEGRFRFGGMAEGEYQIEHIQEPLPGFGERGRIRTNDGEVLIQLDALKLKILGEDGEGQRIGIENLTLIDLEAEETLFTEYYGSPRLALEVLMPLGRRYRLEAETGGVDLEGEFELEAEDEGSEVVLRPITPGDGAALKISVRGPSGASEAKFRISLLQEGDFAKGLEAPRDLLDGAFRGLEPGTYALELLFTAWPPGETSLCTLQCPKQVQLLAGQVTHVEVLAGKGGRVELDLSSVERTAEGHSAKLSAREAVASETSFEQLKVYRLREEMLTRGWRLELGHLWTLEDPLPPGSWVLRLETNDYRTWEQTVVIRPGETTRLSVTMERD